MLGQGFSEASIEAFNHAVGLGAIGAGKFVFDAVGAGTFVEGSMIGAPEAVGEL